MLTAPPFVLDMARAFAARGGRALLVGGWVRDALLGVESKDVDLEVFGLPGDVVRDVVETFGPVNAVGESFTVYKVRDVDVALPRRESKSGRGHRGFDVRGDPFMTFEEAARRRDFTINAIGLDPLTAEVLDPCGGRDDLDRRLLRVVSAETFGDDSLRVLRALQFAARFRLRVDPATVALCRATPLDDLPAERVWGEMDKLLRRAVRPSVGLALARDLDVLPRLFPELQALVGCPQEPEWHPEGDVWVHTLMVVDRARERLDGLSDPEQVALMVGALAHDLGKPATTAVIDGRIRSPNHEAEGVAPALALLDRFRLHTLDGYDVRRQVAGLVAYHLAPGMWHKARTPVGDGAFRRLAGRVDLELLARLSEADCLGRAGRFDCSASAWFRERARSLGVEHRPPAALLLGRHVLALGLPPGPAVGRILSAVYERQLDGQVHSLDEAIGLARELIAAGATPTDDRR
ncbi:MAG: HD domain-containing protein [Vicinamibacterales bacterium]